MLIHIHPLAASEAAQIVLDVPIPKVMIPLNVTHTALLTPIRHAQLLNPASEWKEGVLPEATTPLRSILSSALSFFVESYKEIFGFVDGPPLHDVLTIAYIVAPHLFRTTRYRVDVELGVSHAMGEVSLQISSFDALQLTLAFRFRLSSTFGDTKSATTLGAELG